MTVVECDNKDCKYWIHDDTCTRNRIKLVKEEDSEWDFWRSVCVTVT